MYRGMKRWWQYEKTYISNRAPLEETKKILYNLSRQGKMVRGVTLKETKNTQISFNVNSESIICVNSFLPDVVIEVEKVNKQALVQIRTSLKKSVRYVTLTVYAWLTILELVLLFCCYEKRLVNNYVIALPLLVIILSLIFSSILLKRMSRKVIRMLKE